jgi:hypothetical protein
MIALKLSERRNTVVYCICDFSEFLFVSEFR